MPSITTPVHNSGILGGILDIKKNFRKSREFSGKKLTNSRILEQFELSSDMLATFHRQAR